MRRRVIVLLWGAFLYVGLLSWTSCGTPTYYSSSVGYYGYSGRGGWYDPYYYRPCCYGHRPPDRPHRPPGHHPPGHRPPGERPPGMRPPGSRPPPGMRPPVSRPPNAGRPPSMPSRPRPMPRGGGRR